MHIILTVGVFLLMSQSVLAQGISIEIGGEGSSFTAASLQLIALITVLSLVPALAVMITCFPFIVTVLSILRQGIGLQQAPPNMLIVTLALFLTYFVMDPVFQEVWATAIQPLTEQRLELGDAITRALVPFRIFMADRVAADTLETLAALRPASAEYETLPQAPLSLLVPSFLLSELERAFQIGFLIFLPFLIIDLVVAAVLMSMGMMMVPPAMVSLPFKLAFFVVADGWSLISSALVRSYF